MVPVMRIPGGTRMLADTVLEPKVQMLQHLCGGQNPGGVSKPPGSSKSKGQAVASEPGVQERPYPIEPEKRGRGTGGSCLA